MALNWAGNAERDRSDASAESLLLAWEADFRLRVLIAITD
jgi:hypothetical protein